MVRVAPLNARPSPNSSLVRALQFIGPFVLMIYTIIATDMSRFFLIYSIFLIGFSQCTFPDMAVAQSSAAFYIIFTACERAEGVSNGTTTRDDDEFVNIMRYPTDALIRALIMTIGEFMQLYRQMAQCNSDLMRTIGKICFVVFQMGVSILQFNLLIAMMTRTYEVIFQTRKEWKRQWAQVILMLELSLSPEKRKTYLREYSRPIGTDSALRCFVVSKKSEHDDVDELETIRREKMRRMQEESKALLKRKQREADLRGDARLTSGRDSLAQ